MKEPRERFALRPPIDRNALLTLWLGALATCVFALSATPPLLRALLLTLAIAAAALVTWGYRAWRRTPGVLLIDDEGLQIPGWFASRSKQLMFAQLRATELTNELNRPRLRLRVQRNPFAYTLPASRLQRDEDFARISARMQAADPSRFVDRSGVANPAVISLCCCLLLIGCFVVARSIVFDSAAIEAVRFGALHPGLLAGGDWFRLFSHTLLHASPLQLASTVLLIAGLGADIERRLGGPFVAALFAIGTFVAGCALWLLAAPQLQFGANGAAHALVGAALVLGLGPAQRVPPARLLPWRWWWPLLLVVQVATAVEVSGIAALVAAAAGLGVGVITTFAWLRFVARTGPARIARGSAALPVGAFVLALAALGYNGMRTPPGDLQQTLLSARIDAALALDLAGAVARDRQASRALQQRAFAALSAPTLPGLAALDSGSTGIARADTLALLAWRQSMLGEARAHGLDAVRRAENEDDDQRQRLLARLATYEHAARLPPFVPAAILVRAQTLCALVPSGNPRQYLRAVVNDNAGITGILLGTVDAGETRCIRAPGMSARAHVDITSAEPAQLTSDLHYHPVDLVRALLPQPGA